MESRDSRPGMLLSSLPIVAGVLSGICFIGVAGVVASWYAGWAGALAAVGGCLALIGGAAKIAALVKKTPPPAPEPVRRTEPVRPAPSLNDPVAGDEYDRLRPWVKIGMDLLPIVLAGVAIIGPRRSARFAARGYAMWRAIRDSAAQQEEQEEAVDAHRP